MDYIIIFFGAVLGMALLTTVKSVYVQQSSKYSLGFVAAFKAYTTKHTGPIIVGFLVVFICMFILPEVIAQSQANTESMYFRIIKNVTDRLRIYSVAIGVIGQGLGFIIIRKGEKFLREQEKEEIKKKEDE